MTVHYDYNNPTPTWSTVLPHTDRDDRGEIRRCWRPTVHAELGWHGCRTLYEGWRRGAALNPLGPCLGFRAVSTNGLATPYIYMSYNECLARSEALAAGLEKLHLVAAPTTKSNGDDNGHVTVLALYMKNCPEWVLAEQAAYTMGAATCPLYDTLGPGTVAFVLAQTAARAVVATRLELPKLMECKQSGRCPHFMHVIVADGVTAEMGQRATDAGLNIMSMAKVEALGAKRIATSGFHHSPPSPTDIATFCYTSGTTGDPKGAILTHQNLIAAVAGIASHIPEAEMCLSDRHLSYMPLAHIFERIIEAQIYMVGASIAFYRGDPLYLVEDLQACRPTVLIAAPRVLNKIYDKIQAGIAAAGGVKKKLFDKALAVKSANLLQHGQLTHALYDRLIFNKIAKGLGLDCVRFLVSGSAPLSESVMIFYRCLLGIPVVEGYGQTEAAAAATISHVADMTTVGHVGGPTGAVEIQLRDVPEMGYWHTDRVHRNGVACHGRGEICVRVPPVFVGYYQDDAKTRETIDDEGWLHSGDIGLWTVPDGCLQIIDRKKNIFKLAQGEYVAPEKIENILTRSPLVAQCFVYGDSKESSLVALVVPDQDVVKAAWATDNNMAGKPMEQLCQSDTLRVAILNDLQRLSKENGLYGFETVQAVHLLSELFSVDNDLMTPTFKLKRQKIRDQYEAEIAALYAQIPALRSKL